VTDQGIDSLSDRNYLQVRLPKGRSEVLLLFDCEGKADIKTEGEAVAKPDNVDGDLKIYLPLVKLHLDRLDWSNRFWLFVGKLDNTLYVSKTGILGDSSNSSLYEANISQ
jgi:hypothetical protein